jgi:hypothetical protein
MALRPAFYKIFLIGKTEEELSGDDDPSINGLVPFDVQPIISESGSTIYNEINDIRQAGSMMIFMGSPGRDFSINGRFVSRSREEATLNKNRVQTLRSWRMPEKGPESDFTSKSPARVYLMGYGGQFSSDAMGIPTRMTSLSIEYPDDTDYIHTNDGDYVPIIWPITVSLKETRSVDELKEFNIQDFRGGTLGGW